MNPYVYSRNRRKDASQPADLVSLVKLVFNSAVSPLLAFAVVGLTVVSAGSVSLLAYSEMSQPSELPLQHDFAYTHTAKVLGDSTTNLYPYPSGSLVNDQGTVYFISGNTKVPFATRQAFTGLGYSDSNVINGDLSNYRLAQTYIINNGNATHPWGSWVIYKGTVYYVSESGLIGVPNTAILNSNGGGLNQVVKANSYDVLDLNAAPNLPVLIFNDPRVITTPQYNTAPADNSSASTTTPDSTSTPHNTSTVTARVGQIINLDGTVYLVGSNGLYGFPNLDALTSWGYNLNQAIAPNTAERLLSELGVVSAKLNGCGSVFDQLAGKCASAAPSVSSTVSLSINKTSFCVYSESEQLGDTIQYTVKASPDLAGQQIVWSSTKNSTSTGETNAYYGQNLDSAASWSGPTLHSWSTYDIGTWSKTISVVKNGKVLATSQPVNFVVKDCSSDSAAKPVISGLQGLANGIYSSTISSNQYLVVYGYFAPSGNVVLVNNVVYTPTFQSSSQINVLLGTLTGSVASVDVSNTNGSSNVSKISIADQDGLTPNSSPSSTSTTITVTVKPVISGLQGYTSAGYASTITSNGYLVIYGTFAGQNDAVTVNGTGQTVTYDSKSQINVQLGSLTDATASVVVTNSGVASDASAIAIHNANSSSGTATPLSCSTNVSSINIGDYANFTPTGGNGSYVWINNSDSRVGYGSNLIINFTSSGNKMITVTSGGQTATCWVTVKSAPTGLKSSAPTISGLQGYSSSGYSTTISSNQYLVLYGSFAGSGDSVLVNGVAQSVAYDSVSQINVQLGTLSPGTAAVTVVNSNGSVSSNITVNK